MCLAVPGIIREVDESTEGLRMARVDFGGVSKRICIQFTDAMEGDYILAHAGMAIAVVDAAEAEQTLRDLDAIAQSLEGTT